LKAGSILPISATIPAANIPADVEYFMTIAETVSGVQIAHRPFATLGKANHGWLNANHHFSFASYHDSARMHWGAVRVWNDDEIAAQSGFPPHAHDNMEIITYVREGAITHRDSMGNLGRTEAGDVQVMSAGTGVTHSEYNLENGLCRLFQIWIMPREPGIAPRWDQRQFPEDSGSDGFTLLASGYGDEGALAINADAYVLGANISKGETLNYDLGKGHHAYLVAAQGRVRVNGVEASARDGLAIVGEGAIIVEALENSELVMVDSI
jgi:quercetin 2,3-dioxygenase